MKNTEMPRTPTKPSKVLALFTLLFGAFCLRAGVLMVQELLSVHLSLSSAFPILFLAGFFVPALSGAIGGVLLWQGKRWGLLLAIIAWTHIGVFELLKLIEVYVDAVPEAAVDRQLRVFFIALSIWILFVLQRDYRQAGRELVEEDESE